MKKKTLTVWGRRAAGWLGGMLAMCALVFSFAACDDEKSISFGRLPDGAQTFIETYFPGVGVTSIIREKDDGRTTYDVLLDDGTDIEFNGQGEWTSLDSFFSPLPTGFLPAAIPAKVEELHPGAGIHGVDKEVGGYKVEVLDGNVQWDMYFNTQGEFGREVQDRG